MDSYRLASLTQLEKLALLQQDELESIRSIYGDIFHDVTPRERVWNELPSPHFEVFLVSSVASDRPTISIRLNIEFTRTYPLSPPLVRVLNPQNLLKNRVEMIEKHIADLIAEYPNQEISFILISEIITLLDEFLLTTERVLSLDEEREERLRNGRRNIELQEVERNKELSTMRKIKDAQVGQQLLEICNEYDLKQDKTPNTIKETTASMPLSLEYADHCFVFDNLVFSRFSPGHGVFSFRAVTGLFRSSRSDLLSPVAAQYIVKPILDDETRIKVDASVDQIYLLHRVELKNPFWDTDDGKKQIQELELELQLASFINHTNINRLYAFQIDKLDSCPGWVVHLLTHYSQSLDPLQEIMMNAEYVKWALARNWLIQLLPALEYLHNAGFIHKLVCSQSVVICNEPIDSPQDSLSRTLKLMHPAYGFRLLEMLSQRPNDAETGSFLNELAIPLWRAPELKTDPSDYHQKTDIWDLGVLFLQLMFGSNIVYTDFATPQDFLAHAANHPVDTADYVPLVFDMLSKMFCLKVSRRISTLDLNATKFLRDGPVLADTSLGRLAAFTSAASATKADTPHHTLRQSVSSSLRRYSNQNALSDLKLSFPSNTTLQIGRYERDFEQVGRLGKGGFGEVFKARSRMEGTFYAIKKVAHKSHKLDSLLSEVLSLARLNHQYIVRYYGTWVEDANDDAISDTNSSDLDLESSNETNVNNHKTSPINAQLTSLIASRDNSLQVDYVTHSFDQDIEFAFSSEDENGSDDQIAIASSPNNSSYMAPDSALSFEDLAVSLKEPPKNHLRSILYIQMEFCENNTLSNLIEQGLPSNRSECWRLFRQLLEAVSYIHREGFIHRDLKPMNIFIDKSNNVKVGDFGLAKSSQFSRVISTSSRVSSGMTNDLSTVVGTVFYTANEVATGNYDKSVDMYSLGVILFEMCYPFGTEMERARALNRLRLSTIEFPGNFNDLKYKSERKIIKGLLDHDPAKRLNCTQLLQSGWLPVEHQDEVVKEALRSLADPASPWQQQVRQTLFDQPYLLAKDLMFDIKSYKMGSHFSSLDQSASCRLIFSRMILELFIIFRRHGAIEDYTSTVLLPRNPFISRETLYEVLDRSGQVLSLAYDVTLPRARHLSKTHAQLLKTFRHEFVYRSSLHSAASPDSYSAVGFEICTHNSSEIRSDDAECLKVMDEVIEALPCFRAKSSQVMVIVNHYDILDAIISFAFGSICIEEPRRLEVMAVLSQLGIDMSADETKKLLRESLHVPHTVTKDLVDGFNFSLEPQAAMNKIRKLMVDSPHVIKVERAFKSLLDSIMTLNRMQNSHAIFLSPLANYNCQYYCHGIMFQSIFRLDKSRKFTRIATGGRYDALIAFLANGDVSQAVTPHAVSFTLTTTFAYLLMKNLVTKRGHQDQYLEKWRGSRCEALVLFNKHQDTPSDSSVKLLSYLWKSGLRVDKFLGSADEAISRSKSDGIPRIVLVKQANNPVLTLPNRSTNKSFKPFRARNVSTFKDFDVDENGLVEILLAERDEHSEEEAGSLVSFKPNQDGDTITKTSSIDELDPLYSVDIEQKVILVSNDAPKGRKNINKKIRLEIENDARVALAQMIKQLASCTIITIDARDEVLDMMRITSIHPVDEWVKKIIFVTNNMPKSFILCIHGTLMKEYNKGKNWALICSSKTHKTSLVDLYR